MNLSPHLVVETIRNGTPQSMWRSPEETLPAICALISGATLFEFGDVTPEVEHKEFGVDLYERGLFSLPFPVTAFSYTGAPTPTEFVSASSLAGGMMVLHQGECGRLDAIVCNEYHDQFGRAVGALPIAVMLNASFSTATKDSCDVSETSYPLVSDDMMATMYGDAGQAGHELMRRHLCDNLLGSLGLSILLMSKGVTTQRVAAPDKLNKNREKKGKCPIHDRYVVNINLSGDSKTLATEDGEANISGHVRGLPRLHWRRGHYRTIFRGSERERVVPVAPALIGANGSAPHVPTKNYVVGRS